MPHILLLSTAFLPHEDLDSAPLAAALAARRVDSSVVNWADPDSWPYRADLAVIRTTWDYSFRRDEFLHAMEQLPMPLANPATVVRWNSHKGYLVELAESGVPVVPTVLIRQHEAPVAPLIDAAQIIIKPAISAGARGVGLFGADAAEATEHLADLLTRSDVVVQPFEPSVSAGERSLMFFGGRYSHAVLKIPANGDFRVQLRYGGRLLPHQATASELAVAAAALQRVGTELLYARVDLVGTPERPLVMELELIEPEIFLPMADQAAGRFADAIISILSRQHAGGASIE